MDAYKLHRCALAAITSRYSHAYGRQAEPMFASLVRTVKYLGLIGTVWKIILQMDAIDTILLLGEQVGFQTGCWVHAPFRLEREGQRRRVI